MFWDITDNRGEFPAYPLTGAQRMIWVTDPNGYTRTLNQNNLNYNKPQMERKKFRHLVNKVLLSKNISGDVSMVMRNAINKDLVSLR